MHEHEFAEINIVVRGSGLHHFQGHVFETTAGDVFVIPPHARHGYSDGERLDVYHLLLSPQIVSEQSLQLHLLPGYLPLFTVEPYFRSETGMRHALRLDDAQLAQIGAILDAMVAEITLSKSGVEMSLRSLALYAQVLLCRWYADRHAGEFADRHPQASALGAVFEYIAAHYGEKIRLQDLADAACMQRTYFCSLFHRATGMTPMDYLGRYRLLAARQQLRETDATITRIAHDAGFYDTAHFTRAFTKLTGMTPSRFRRGG
jgi:AraC family L-rhamnose operon transcriptional activator RhaR/AraC family L-rhamnose operon regulatory protein RhaS